MIHSADQTNSPPTFRADDGAIVTFVDFIEAHYRLTLDVSARRAFASSIVTFESHSKGKPAISLKSPASRVLLDARDSVVIDQIAPDYITPLKLVDRTIDPGIHRLEVIHDLASATDMSNTIRWTPGRVHCVLHMSDLDDAFFLGSHFVSNLEYDHHSIRLTVEINHSQSDHHLITNGLISQSGRSFYTAVFPPFFTTSFPWIHIAPADALTSLAQQSRSSDNRDLRFTIYALRGSESAAHLNDFFQEARRSVSLLETHFGPFPYSSLTLFATGMNRGGMEYAGASAVEFGSIRHELDHSYFARCIAPSSGDAGWIDEAIASWGDSQYIQSEKPPQWGSNMGRRSKYIRETSRDAYQIGRELLSYFDYRLRDSGGLKPVLARYFAGMRETTTSNEQFKAFIEHALGSSVDSEFDEFVYGRGSSTPFAKTLEHNPHHYDSASDFVTRLFPI